MTANRILVVDDDLHIRRLLESALVRAGYVPIEATTAAEALEQAKNGAPDAILLDLDALRRSSFCRRVNPRIKR